MRRRNGDVRGGWASGAVCIVCVVLGLAAPTAKAEQQAPAATETLSRIAFGSCIRQNKPQPIWDAVVAARPQLFLLIGDNIYGDTEDMRVLKAKYDALAANPGFQALRRTCPLLGTWDDHDFGVNDGGTEYPRKAESQQLLLDFFGEPADSPRRRREGVYDAKLFGPPDRRVQVILLDTRYHRSPLKRNPRGRSGGRGPYLPDDNPEKTMLGEAQWRWLGQQLRQPARLRIVASSIQVAATQHRWETWGNLPHERDRLFKTISKTGAAGVVFISGDRHKAEISRLDAGDTGVGYPLYDLTSSSLNQPSKGALDEVNEHRVASERLYGGENFGVIEVDWSAADPTVNLHVRDMAGKVVIGHRAPLSALQPKPAE